MTALSDRIAGAPISWGVCEVPGWGWQADSETVLSQVRQVGLVATELGPAGFLPREPQAPAKATADQGLPPFGGHVPAVPRAPDGKPDLTGVWMHEITTVEEVERLFGSRFDDSIKANSLGVEIGSQHR